MITGTLGSPVNAEMLDLSRFCNKTAAGTLSGVVRAVLEVVHTCHLTQN